MSHLMTLLHIVKQLCRCCAGHCCRCCNVMQLLPCCTVVLVVRHTVEPEARWRQTWWCYIDGTPGSKVLLGYWPHWPQNYKELDAPSLMRCLYEMTLSTTFAQRHHLCQANTVISHQPTSEPPSEPASEPASVRESSAV